MRTKYTKDELSKIINESFSTADCLRRLGVRACGGNYSSFRKAVKYFGIDTSHFTGSAWNRGSRNGFNTRTLPLNSILIKDSPFASSSGLRVRLIREGVKERKCEKCNNSEWMGQEIPLELEHCNGDNTDNRIENLQILCPNCHAQTPFYRGRNKLSVKNERLKLYHQNTPAIPKLKEENKCQCGRVICRRSSKCVKCDRSSRLTRKPSIDQLLKDFEELISFVQVGKKYGVSDNAVRKWLASYGIKTVPSKKFGY